MGLSASKYAAPPDDDDDIEKQMNALSEYKRQSIDPDFPVVLDYHAPRLERDWKMDRLMSVTAQRKRGEDLDQAYAALIENEAYLHLGGQSAKRPPNPCLHYQFVPSEDFVEKALPLATTGDLIMNLGHFVGFDVMGKLLQYIREPEKPNCWIGSTAAWRSQKFDPENPTPKVAFCSFKSLHAAIQCNPDALKHFLSANFNQVVWFGSGHTVLAIQQ